MTGGKYRSNLGSDLMAPDVKLAREVKVPKAGSQLAVGALVPQFVVASVGDDVVKPPPPPKPARRVELPPPPPPEPEPAPAPREVRHCIFTGDDLPEAPVRAAKPHSIGAPVTGEKYQRWLGGNAHDRGDSALQRGVYVYNQEAVAAPVAVPPSLKVLREWKTRMVMPETLDQHEGFHRPGTGMASNSEDAAWKAQQDAAWHNESEWRQWEDGQKKLEHVRRREVMDRQVANGAISAYGEKLPARGRGDVFAPFADRRF